MPDPVPPSTDGTPSDARSFEAMASEVDQEVSPQSTTDPTVSCPGEETLFIRIALKDEEGQPVAEVPYRLEVDGTVWERKTTSDGLVEQEVPVGATEGELLVWRDGDQTHPPEEYELALAQMDPLGLPSGHAARLHNLGFTGSDTEAVDEADVDEAAFYFRLWAGLADDVPDEGVESVLGAFYEPKSTMTPVDAFVDPEASDQSEDEQEQ